MGSNKKKRGSSSSSSSSDSDGSDSSAEEQSKRNSKKRRNSSTDNKNVKQVKSDDRSKTKSKEDVEKDNRERKQRHSPSLPPKDRYRQSEEQERKGRDDRGRHEDRRTRPDDRNDRRYDDRSRNRLDHRSDRERDYRDQRDNRERDHRNQRNDRERDYRDRREDNRNRNRDRFRDDHRRRRSRSASFDHSNARWGRNDDKKSEKDNKPKDKQKPEFGLSGKLTEERNTFKGVVIKYSEPPEARKPKRRWRLYPFKGEKALQTLYIHRESAYLIGRDRKVVDLPVDHPSCSKQHAALQYRLVPFTRDDGSTGKKVRPYLIDLDSANGTYINNKRIEPKKYVELLEKDVIKFGYSSREYVLLHENSKDETQDDDVKQEEEVVVKTEEN